MEKNKQKQLITEIMNEDAKDGLYNKQTAIDWLFQKLWEEPKDKFTWYVILKQAKEMHNQEQIDLLKFSKEMCTPDAPIEYIIKEFNK